MKIYLLIIIFLYAQQIVFGATPIAIITKIKGSCGNRFLWIYDEKY